MANAGIGIIGAGFAADFHLKNYQRVRGAEVRGIASRTPERAARLAVEYDVPCVYDSVNALFADPLVDTVDICAPNNVHVPLVVRAAARGKHVFCEKPLGGYFGPSDAAPGMWSASGFPRGTMLKGALEQADAVHDAVRRAGTTFCYGENWVYSPLIQKANGLMEAGDTTILRIVGEESHSGSHAAYARRWQTAGGGSLARLSVHPLGAALYLKHEEGRRRNRRPIRPAFVTAEVANLTAIESFQREQEKYLRADWDDVEDYGSIILTFEDGSVAEISATDTVLGGIYNRLTIYGSNKVVEARINPNDMVRAYTPDGRHFGDEYIVEKAATKAGWSNPAPIEDVITGYADELNDFVGAIAQGREPLSGLTLAHDVLTVVYAAYLAAEQGARVDVRPFLRR